MAPPKLLKNTLYAVKNLGLLFFLPLAMLSNYLFVTESLYLSFACDRPRKIFFFLRKYFFYPTRAVKLLYIMGPNKSNLSPFGPKTNYNGTDMSLCMTDLTKTTVVLMLKSFTGVYHVIEHDK